MLPTHLLPSALGLEWGLTKEECLARLGAVPLKESQAYAIIEREIEGRSRQIVLLLSDRGTLERIKVDLHVSRSFWDKDEYYTTEDVERIDREYYGYYTQLVACCAAVLDPPAFSGSYDDPGYPESETVASLTYWDHPEGRLQVEYDQPDTEFPFFVSVTCYYVGDRGLGGGVSEG